MVASLLVSNLSQGSASNGMEKQTFFETNVRPLVKELEQAAEALNDVCEESKGICFLLKGTLDRIVKEFNEKITAWDAEYVVSAKEKER